MKDQTNIVASQTSGAAIRCFAVCLLLVMIRSTFVLADKPAEVAQPAAKTADQSELYDRAKAASIEVLVKGQLAGSGWVANAEGHAFTASHVVKNHKQVEVTGPFGRQYAKVIAVDRGHDLALLQLPKRDKPYAFLPTSKKTLKVGQEIYLFGAPMNRHAVMFPGRVGRKGTAFEYLGGDGFYIEAHYVIGTSPLGTSGGPWFNASGEIVGLQSGLMQRNDAQVTIAFVTPATAVARLLEEKKSAATPTVRGAFEEIWEHNPKFIAKFPPRTEGLVVRVIQKDGPLDRAKLKIDDLILAADGKPIRYRDQMLRLIRSKKPGDTIELRYFRPGVLGSSTVDVQLDSLEPK